MEKHPLESWDQWVLSELQPAVLMQLNQEVLNRNLATAKELKEALQTQLLRDTLYNKTEIEVQLLVERYQIKLTSLMDRLFHFQHDDPITDEINEFYGAVAAQLEMVIVLLQNDYGRHFNSHLNLPLSLRLREADVLKGQWNLLFKTMGGLDANVRILHVLVNSINGILDLHERPAISYRQVSYQIILNWIAQEQAYLQAIVALPEKKEALEGAKIHTSLSISILAVINRLFKDSGIIINTNQTEIFDFFSSHFVNQQKKRFPYEHLRTRYYNVEERTKNKAYEYLMELVQLCKKL